MIFSNKTFAIVLSCGIVFSSAYAFVNAGQHYEAEMPQPEQLPGKVKGAIDKISSTVKSTIAAMAVDTASADTSKQPAPTFPIKKYTQNSYEELDSKYPMDAPKPENVKSVVEYDSKSGNYILRTMVGEMEIATPFLMTEQEYRNYSAKKDLQQYWKEKNGKAEKNNEDKFSISDMKFNIGPADKVFGPGGVQIKTQGSAELVFGYKSNKIDNPALTERMRKTGNFNFDEKIQLNVTGNVGDKVNFGLNYNTESSFDFDQKMVKLAYKGKEDDIIKSIEAGNVSMQLNSSLITGSTALFGVKTDLQFGRLSVSAIASQQESQTQTVSSKGGAQTTKFEVNIDNYDDNRHFFLGHYFRNNYENAMSKLPYISSGITINRVEVWVTNKRGNYDQARNIIAFMDLAENEVVDKSYWHINPGAIQPANNSNELYRTVTGSNFEGLRDIQKTNDILARNLKDNDINGGEDYEKIESARKLEQSEYTLNSALGFISLRNALNPDEVLGVSYEYTYGGKVYQVGEFSTDNITPPNALIVKLLKSTAQSPLLASWDLMMKNVYDLGAMDIQKENFKFNIVYRNDSIGTDMQYITEGDSTKNKILLRVMNLDNLDSREAPNPDGRFDFVEGYTVLPSSGRIIFPVLEPFGEHLAKAIDHNFNPNIPNSEPSKLALDYIFQELYDSTLVVAQESGEKNKFKLVGEYKASSGSEIRLNAMNVPRGSVTVTAGGATLVENVDYTVDYTMGTVSILNQSLIESGTNIDVKLENQSMFSMQRKSLVGTHLEYKFNKDFSLGGTIMHLSEMPLTTKVNTGSEPISNTIWGLNTSWRTESQWLTNMLDKLPFVNATKPSTIAMNAEFAQLIPGHSKVVGKDGLAYIDDFESTKTTIDIHYPINWYLAATPYNDSPKSGYAYFEEAKKSNDIEYGKNRALLAWYYVDPLFNEPKQSTPSYIRNDPDSKSNNLTRSVLEQEIFPNKQTDITRSPRMTIMNLSFYPKERGPYNLDVDGMNPDGTLNNPTQRWGGIMRKLDATDFETSNIEYIEFWMMDPYVNGGMTTDKKGDLYFNLGDMSEDILKDGKKTFEHGLPIDGDMTKTDTTVWGRVPKIQSTVTAFSGDRKNQDVGLDGLPTESEFFYPAYKDYVDKVKAKITDPAVLQRMENDKFSPLRDPAGDNYHFYRGTDYDNEQLPVLMRYKHYNGVEGNSPDANDITEKYSTTSTSLPDMEDVNGDNTLNEYEKYFLYRVRINPDSMEIGKNHITDVVRATVTHDNDVTDEVKWYQFKIPIREYEDKIGSIRNFKSIRFIRMFMTNFQDSATLRFATLDLVRGEWRNFNKQLHADDKLPTTNGKLDVQAVNIEENASKSPVNYILPPGVTRETDPGQPALLQLNEQSMVMRVSDLSPGDARGVYKNTAYDMRQYKRLQMFVHAEKMKDDVQDLKDYELTCFVRLGSDLVNNYYEYEIPLRLTPGDVLYNGDNTADRQKVWYPENMFDFAFESLTGAKLKRNKEKQSLPGTVSNLIPYTVYDPDKPLNKITIVGNPSISDVQTIMIGLRNAGTSAKSGEIWVNEMRMSQFDESGGWAAMGNLAVGLSDLGSVNLSGRVETAGYGSIESNVTNRRLDDLYQMNFSTSMDLGRFLPEQAKLQIPAYFSYTNETLSPKYNPLDQDVLLSEALDNETLQQNRDTLLMVSQTVNTSKSFNVSGVKVNIKSKTPQFYDPANVSFTYAYNETNQHSADIEKNLTKDERASVVYNFSFNPEPVEPFKNVKAFDKPAFKLIKEFNFYYLPSALNFNTNMNRQFSQVKLRELNAASTGALPMDLTFSKDFMWNKQFDIKYDLTKTIKFSFQTAMNSNIAEPYFTPEIGKEYYEQWRDSVWSSIRKLGNPYTYQQMFTASWNLPINKIPLLDWITANASYNSTYNWNKMAQIKGNTADLGNIATSMGAWQGDAQFNFESFYNKSKYLKDVNRRFSSQMNNGNKPKFQSKTYTQKVVLEKGKLLVINHRLGSERLKFTAVDNLGKPVMVNYKSRNVSTIEIIPTISSDSLLLTMVSLDPDVQSVGKTAVDIVARTLMMVRRGSITYRQSNSMMLPGFLPTPGLIGQQNRGGITAPGYAFTFGVFDDNTIENFDSKGWLYKNEDIVNPATMGYISDLDVKASIEPIPGFKIDLNAKRYEAQNTSIQYMFEGMPRTFNGSYNITLMALSTAFKPIGSANQNYSSELFDKLISNRQVIANRLSSKYVGTDYPDAGFLKDNISGKYDPAKGAFDLNSADVLIPSFLAAYTGRDVNTVNTNPFLSFLSILPNWRVNYDGLSNIGWVKDNFKSVSLTHAYTCRYSIGSYTSYATWVAMGKDEDFGYVATNDETKAIPSSPYSILDVSLSEQFSPLIGVNVALKNSMTGKLEYRKQRNMVLNLSSTQLIESTSDEFVIGAGYLLKDFDVILRLKSDQQSKIKNDLKLSADLSYKDIKTLLRKVEETITQASSGNKLFTLKIIADYVFSSKVNIQLFYDRQASTPLISSSFPVASSNFGVSFKFMLTR